MSLRWLFQKVVLKSSLSKTVVRKIVFPLSKTNFLTTILESMFFFLILQIQWSQQQPRILTGFLFFLNNFFEEQGVIMVIETTPILKIAYNYLISFKFVLFTRIGSVLFFTFSMK